MHFMIRVGSVIGAYVIWRLFQLKLSNLTLCIPCIVTNYVSGQKRCTFYIYLLHNFHFHSTCFERSNRSSSGVNRSVLYYTALYNRANMSSCFGLTVGTVNTNSTNSTNSIVSTNSKTTAAGHIRTIVQSCAIQYTTINTWWWTTRPFETCNVDMKIVE